MPLHRLIGGEVQVPGTPALALSCYSVEPGDCWLSPGPQGPRWARLRVSPWRGARAEPKARSPVRRFCKSSLRTVTCSPCLAKALTGTEDITLPYIHFLLLACPSTPTLVGACGRTFESAALMCPTVHSWWSDLSARYIPLTATSTTGLRWV